MSMEQWWNDTDRGKLKYWEKSLFHWPFQSPIPRAFLCHVVARFLNETFLCVLAKLRNVTIRFVLSVSPSAWNNSAPIGRIVIKCDVCAFESLSRKFYCQ